MKNLLLIHDYFNNKLPASFGNYFIFDKDKHLYLVEDIRPTKIPDKFNDFIMSEQNMQPQQHPIPGQLYRPEYETVRYGRDSLKISAINSWNHLNHKHHQLNPDNDFISMSRESFKKLIITDFMDSYERYVNEK